jgi:hypothetical protein
MPQTITPRVHCTVKLAANDLATVNYAGGEGGGIFIRNYGPGDVWLSADPQNPAAIGNQNNFLLAKTDYVAMGGVSRGAYLTLMSDQSNTQVSIAFSSK